MLTGMLSSSDFFNTQRFWHEYFKDPTQRWDDRSNELSGKLCKSFLSFDFIPQTFTASQFGQLNFQYNINFTRETQWVGNWRTQESVKKVLANKNPRTFLVQSGSGAYKAGIAGSAIQKRSFQLDEVKKIHAHMMESGNKLLLTTNIVIDMYVKCGSMVDAHYAFDNLLKRDVVAWNMMILGYAKQENGRLALELFARMQQEGVQPNDRTFIGALKACSGFAIAEQGKFVDGKFVKIRSLERGRAIHSQIVKSGFELGIYVGNTLVDTYSKCGSMEDACHVFDKLPPRDVVSWTAMISGYAKQYEGMLSLEYYAQMLQQCVQPNDRTFVCALKACSALATLEDGNHIDGKCVKLGCLEKGRSIHSHVVRSGYDLNVIVGNILVDMYVKCGTMEDACHVFDKYPYHDVVSWTAMMSGYAKQEESALALEFYARMHQEGVHPNDRTFVCVLNTCSKLAALEEGKLVNGIVVKTGCLEKGRAIHSQVMKSGLDSDLFVGNTLVDMYSKSGSMEDAHYVFHELPHRDVVSWTAMISGYTNQEEGLQALGLYDQMHQEGVRPNDRTFVCVLKACSSLSVLEVGKGVDGDLVKAGCLEKGRAIHSQLLQCGFESDVFVGTTLVDMYAKCGSMEDAWHTFNELPHYDVVAWNAMIFGYAEKGESRAALELYAQMQGQGLSPDSLTFISVLKACGNIAALETGRGLHEQIRRVGLPTAGNVANTLIDMYAKCGSMDDAQQLFDALPTRNVVTWNALLAGYAHQGASKCVFQKFERMRQEGIQPDGLVFLSILNVCSHVGLVDKGKMYFQAMSKQYNIVPTIEHYNCMVDLLGRAGQVDKAVAMVEKMPFEPDVVVWLTVLSACRKWKNVEVGRHAFEHVVKLDGKRAAPYILMSSIYAHAHMWEDHEKITVMRKNAQAWKKPGQSWWTDLGGTVHTFLAGDTRHPHSKDIYSKLKDLSIKMKQEGYVPDLTCVLQGISDNEKEDALCGHSEKLAVSCALINTPEGTPIRVVKNLRICDDCHQALALISRIEHRNIICRDASRFHDYKDGQCSCGGYW